MANTRLLSTLIALIPALALAATGTDPAYEAPTGEDGAEVDRSIKQQIDEDPRPQEGQRSPASRREGDVLLHP